MNYPFAKHIYEFVILGSRFIGLVIPFDDEKEIGGLLAKVREEYPKATHYPYAARLLPFERCSDEGEPARSTGLPLLEILRGREVDHVLLVVVRYFGGTKLGLGRLTRTYRDVGLKAVEETVMADLVEGYEASLSMGYSDFSTFEKEATRLGATISEQNFLEKVSLKLSGDAKIVKPLIEKYANLISIDNEKESLVKRRKEQ
ncbi:MAG: YigZ family protein [Bacilli bacterium]|nr:YigZ family protein [Bacilli bacterium]